MPHALAAALFAAAMVALGAASAGIGSASAQSSTIGEVSSRATNPQPWLGDKPFITEKRHMGGNHWVVDVWYPANRAVISNNVLLPEGDKPRPSFYLLPGIEGGQAGMNWMTHTDIRHWAVGKNVNVVMPLGGAALDIAGHAPQRYKAAASYSGCPVRSGAIGFPTSTAMIAYGGGSSFTAWGLPGSPQWFEHDPNANPGCLRDVEVFVGSASRTPGPHRWHQQPRPAARPPRSRDGGRPVLGGIHPQRPQRRGACEPLLQPPRFAHLRPLLSPDEAELGPDHRPHHRRLGQRQEEFFHLLSVDTVCAFLAITLF